MGDIYLWELEQQGRGCRAAAMADEMLVPLVVRAVTAFDGMMGSMLG